MHTVVVHSSRSEACRRNAPCGEGREDVKDNATSDRPSTARTDEEVEAVAYILTTLRVPPNYCKTFKHRQGYGYHNGGASFRGEKGVRKICASRCNNAARTGMGYVLSGL